MKLIAKHAIDVLKSYQLSILQKMRKQKMVIEIIAENADQKPLVQLQKCTE
jgi:hypothetical protein